MIWYFSGTGNSRWVAEELARQTGDRALDIMAGPGPHNVQDEVFGIIFPIHAWSVPEIVEDFLKGLSGDPSYAYAVCTCGEDAGAALDSLKKRYSLDSIWSVALPSNYIMGLDLEPEDRILKKFREARGQVQEIAASVLSRECVVNVHRGSLAGFKTALIGRAFQKAGRSTRPFAVSSACTGCSLCAASCPARAIEMVGGRPQWIRRTCYLCTACINRCPVDAIDYGSKTKGRKRYRIEEYFKAE